ncbi:MAG TPA: 2-C-methyl-D-erythritol 2,4-cyclodiphosphate synthase [Actinomycetota bacterium]|nr:2-C-methyl-D-erythritol 2,4-cyclodiphosphate synthase [Actinomycetota bacterium]
MGEPLVGLGLDVHPADPNRPLFLAGVRFEGVPGLAGHSDGDVVCHALADALLGSAGLGDLGDHFPEADPAYEGIAGLDLLSRVGAMLTDRQLVARRCDVTILADRPSIAPVRDEMRRNLAAALSVSIDDVSVKATRPEGLGLTGDGAACIAVVTVVPFGSR